MSENLHLYKHLLFSRNTSFCHDRRLSYPVFISRKTLPQVKRKCIIYFETRNLDSDVRDSSVIPAFLHDRGLMFGCLIHQLDAFRQPPNCRCREIIMIIDHSKQDPSIMSVRALHHVRGAPFDIQGVCVWVRGWGWGRGAWMCFWRKKHIHETTWRVEKTLSSWWVKKPWPTQLNCKKTTIYSSVKNNNVLAFGGEK